MKSFLYSLVFLAGTFGFTSCKDTAEPAAPHAPQAGIVTGQVVDRQGKPVANAHLIANSTNYYNSTSDAYTDAKGMYKITLPTGIAAGSYNVEGTITLKYHGQNYKLQLYTENDRSFSAYDGAVRNFEFRLTGKRKKGAADTDGKLGATLEVSEDHSAVERKNLEVTLEPIGPLVDGSTGKRIVTRVPENGLYVEDIPVGKYKITARDISTNQPLGVSIHGSLKPYTPSVTGLFVDDDFVGSTFFRLAINVGSL